MSLSCVLVARATQATQYEEEANSAVKIKSTAFVILVTFQAAFSYLSTYRIYPYVGVAMGNLVCPTLLPLPKTSYLHTTVLHQSNLPTFPMQTGPSSYLSFVLRHPLLLVYGSSLYFPSDLAE